MHSNLHQRHLSGDAEAERGGGRRRKRLEEVDRSVGILESHLFQLIPVEVLKCF